MKLILQIPLLTIILVIFNVVIFNNPVALTAEASPLFSITLPTGGRWLPTVSDLLVIGGVILLYLELFKATRTNVSAIFEHVLSLFVFLVFLIEFIVVPAAGN